MGNYGQIMGILRLNYGSPNYGSKLWVFLEIDYALGMVDYGPLWVTVNYGPKNLCFFCKLW